MASWGPKALEITVPEGEKLRDLHSQGKGLIILSAHVGCWQIAFSALEFLKTSVHIVMHRHLGDVDKHYFEHHTQKVPFEIIDPADYLGGSIAMAAALEQKGILGMMGDRLFSKSTPSIKVDFLGEPISIPLAPFRLAGVSGSPIAVMLSHKVGFSNYQVDLAGVINCGAGNPSWCRKIRWSSPGNLLIFCQILRLNIPMSFIIFMICGKIKLIDPK